MHVAALVCGLIFLAASVFCLTGFPEPLHEWWDGGCSCKCDMDEYTAHHHHKLHHPRLHIAGIGLGSTGTLIVVAMAGWMIVLERRSGTPR